MPFVGSSWFRSFRPYARRVSLAVYEEEQNKLIRQILKRSETWVAYSADVPDEILGYAVVEGDVLHFVYVKSVYRKMGIARGLVRGRVKWYTHETGDVGRSFAKALGLVHNPYKTGQP